MTDNYYGFTHTPNARDDRYVTYSGDQHDLPDDSTTSWGSPDSMTVDIQQMWQMIADDDPEMTDALVMSWRRARELLDILAQNLRRHTDALERNWRSPEAKPAFLQHVGAALYSFEDWRDRADHNATYLNTVATQLRTTKEKVQDIYTEWVDKFNERTAQAATQKSLWSQLDGDDGAWEDDDFDDWKRQKTDEARPHMTALAGAFDGGYVVQGYRYKGPLNARKPNLDITAPTPPGAPRRPGPTAPPPVRPPAVVPVATHPPTPPTEPGVPTPTQPGPVLQSGVITPPAPPPTAPAAPPTPPAPSGTLPPPLPPGATRPPAVTRPAGTAPTAPGTANRGAAPNRPGAANARPGVPPSMQGRQAAAGRPPALPPGAKTAKPGAPGSNARPAQPPAGKRAGRPGGTDAGRAGAGGRGGMPGTPPGAQRRTAPGRPTAPPVIGERGRGGPVQPPSTTGRQGKPSVIGRKPGAPGKTGTQNPRSTPATPQIGGRAAATPPPTSAGRDARRTVRQDLGGRSGTGPAATDRTATQGRKPRPRRSQTTPQPHTDEELWTVDTPGGEVIDAGGQEHPHDPGPAMGR